MKRFALILCLFMAGWAGAATFYFDPVSGNNGNDGLSEGQAWADANSAEIAGKFSSGSNGDIYKMMTGFHHGIHIGSKDSRTIEALAGHSPTFAFISAFGESNLTIRGLEISPSLETPSMVTQANSNADRSMIGLAGGQADSLLIDNCVMYTVPDHNVWTVEGDMNSPDWGNLSWYGINDCVTCNGTEIRNTLIYNVQYATVMRSSSDVRVFSGNTFRYYNADALRFSAPQSNLTITNNVFTDAVDADEGGTHSDAIQFDDGTITGVTISNNFFDARNVNSTLDIRIYEPQQCIFQSVGDINDCNFFNNIIFTNSIHGISYSQSDNTDVVNNTLYRSPGTSDGFIPRIRCPGGATNCYVANNIAVVDNYPNGVDGNINTNNFASTSFDPNREFVDYLGHDPNLVVDSNFLDVGTDVNAPATDFAGNSRSSPPDVGALERVVAIIQRYLF